MPFYFFAFRVLVRVETGNSLNLDIGALREGVKVSVVNNQFDNHTHAVSFLAKCLASPESKLTADCTT